MIIYSGGVSQKNVELTNISPEYIFSNLIS